MAIADPPTVTVPTPRQAVAVPALAVAVVVASARWWIARRTQVFTMIPDEAAQLAMARTLAGDRWSMLDYSTFRPGFSITISPIWWFTDDPSTGLAWVWVVNAVLGGASAALYVVAVRRLTDLGVIGSALAAAAVALGPAMLFTTRYAWAEALVQPVVVGFVLLLVNFADHPTAGRGVAVVGVAAFGFMVHSRLLPLSFVALGLVVVLVARHQIARRAAAIVVGSAVAALVLTTLVAAAVIDLTWTEPFTTNSVRGALGQWRQAGSMLVTTLGHLWYQLVASLGLAGLGTWVLLHPPPGGRSRRRDGALVVVTVATLMALSVAFLAGRERPDRLVYGRYTDPASTLLVLVGLAAIVRDRAVAARRLFVLAGGTVALGGVLVALRGEELRQGGALRMMVLGLQPMAGNGTTIPVGPATAVAAVTMVVLAVVTTVPRRARATLLVVGLGLTVGLADLRVRERLDRTRNVRLDTADVTELVAGDDPLLPAGAAVRVHFAPEGVEVGLEGFRQRVQYYQFFLPGHRFDLDGDEPAPTPYVVAPSDDPGLASTPGADLLWREHEVAIGLWFVPTG